MRTSLSINMSETPQHPHSNVFPPQAPDSSCVLALSPPLGHQLADLRDRYPQVLVTGVIVRCKMLGYHVHFQRLLRANTED